MVDVEAGSLLLSVLEVIERDGRALAKIEDPRLEGVLHSIGELQAAIVIALTMMGRPPRTERQRTWSKGARATTRTPPRSWPPR